jgi:predicted peptidase
VPAWIFHGADDPIIPVAESRVMADALTRAGGDVRYTEYPGVAHDSWAPAYAEPELMPWMLSRRSGSVTEPLRND